MNMPTRKNAQTFHVEAEEVRTPGSLIYTGEYRGIQTELEVYQFDSKSLRVEKYHRPEDLPQTSEEGVVTWINIIGLNDPKVISYFGQRFGLHEMHLEDIVQVNRHAKAILAEDYLMSEHYMIFGQKEIHHESVVLFLLKGFILSFQECPGDVFDGIRRRLQDASSRVRQKKEDYLYYLMIDALVDEAVGF